MSRLEVRRLGRLGYTEAFEMQRQLVEQRKRGEIPNVLLFVEHPHVITLGRNAHLENVLASPERLSQLGIAVEETDRGGDVTYHGPGQIVGYPIFDLKEWKRDVGLYLRAVEQAIIDALAHFGLHGQRAETGVWVDGAKVAAIGVHLSRWVTSHGFALNHTTDLSYFKHIIPCGLTKPVTSMEALGVTPPRQAVEEALASTFAAQFELTLTEAALTMEGKS